MVKIGVLGDKESVQCYAALGLSVFYAETEEEGARTLRSLMQDEYGIVYITEELASRIPTVIDESLESPLPAVVLIPGVKNNTGEGMKQVRRSVLRAVGSDIIFGDEAENEPQGKDKE